MATSTVNRYPTVRVRSISARADMAKVVSSKPPLIWLVVAIFMMPILVGVTADYGAAHLETTNDTAINPSMITRLIYQGGSVCIFSAGLLGLWRSRRDPYRTTFNLGSRMTWLWISMMLFWGGQVAIGILADPHEIFRPRLYLGGLTFTALYVARRGTYDEFYSIVQRLQWFNAVATLIALVVAFGRVTSEVGAALPGVSFRLHGFLHANHLAYLIASYWLLPRPKSASWRGRPLRLLLELAVLVVFVLAQGKTMYIMVAAGFVVKWVVHWLSTTTRLPRLAFVSFGALFGLACLMVSPREMAVELFSWTGADTRSLESFTGRTEIWDMMLSDWSRSPISGYGYPEWAEQLSSVKLGKWVAPQAHNVYVQLLWESGLLGLALLGSCSLALLYCAWKSPLQYRGGMVACVFLILVGGWTEITINLFAVPSVAFAVFNIVFVAACWTSGAMAPAAQSAPPRFSTAEPGRSRGAATRGLSEKVADVAVVNRHTAG